MLSPRERIDLDTVCERREIESSVQLKSALKKGYVKVVVKDREGFDPNQSAISPNTITKDDLDKVKQDIAGIIKDALSSIKVVGSSNEVISQDDTKASGIEMSDAVLEAIHKKAVDRLMTNSEKAVEVKQSKTNNVNINKNLDELEGLL
jgi:hypothetical protein